jgi:hypothetical protein
LQDADVPLEDSSAQATIADKAYDAEARAIEPLQKAGMTLVISQRIRRQSPREYDRDLYKARHLIRKLLCAAQAVSRHCNTLWTRRRATFWAQSIWLPLWFGLTDDTPWPPRDSWPQN